MRYQTITHQGNPSSLPFDKLGSNGINILSVAIPGAPNQRTRAEVMRFSLEIVVRHAEQKEWMDRPEYQDGLPAFDTWALACERGAILAGSGKIQNVAEYISRSAFYYADHYYGSRCYARDYLKQNGVGDKHLDEAASCFADVAEHLKPVWEFFRQLNLDDAVRMRCAGRHIREAKEFEERGIRAIHRYLLKSAM